MQLHSLLVKVKTYLINVPKLFRFTPQQLLLQQFKDEMMKKLLVGALFLMFIFFTNAQNIKKVSVDELKTVIDTSKKALVINFWATWCKPCVEELPYLVAQTKAYANKGVELILVSLDFEESYPKDIKAFLRKKNYEATNFWLSETDANEFCPKIDKKWEGTIPVTLMINNSTKYRKFYGYALTPKELEEALKQLTK